MQNKKLISWKSTSPKIAVAALIVSLLTFITIPFTFSKYIASADATASARVAKFHNQFLQVSGHLGGAGYAVRSTASGYPTANQITQPIYYYKNNSEVAVNVKLIPFYGPGPYAVGANAHSTAGYQVGEYASTGTRTSIPPTLSGGFSGSFNGTSKTQLGYTVYRGATTSVLANATSPAGFTTPVDITPNAALTTGGADLKPGEAYYLGVFFQTYNSAPTQYANRTTTGGTTYDMDFAWRTYRINYDLRVTQID